MNTTKVYKDTDGNDRAIKKPKKNRAVTGVGFVMPKYGDKYRHKQTGRIAHVCTEPSGPSGSVRLGYGTPDGSTRRGRRIWVRVQELHEKFDRAQRRR